MKQHQHQQWLVSFCNKTHVLNLPPVVSSSSSSSSPRTTTRHYDHHGRDNSDDHDDGDYYNNNHRHHEEGNNNELIVLEKQQQQQKAYILEQLSFLTGWPSSNLEFVVVHNENSNNHSNNCCTVRVVSGIRGGKGGFGTLLRSSARQSGAKLTTDFGACRDLQGRRLRHVNDEIKLRKWREEQERKKNGQQGEGEGSSSSMFDTPSGLYNWHLMVPSWADISKKSTKKIQRQFKRMQQEKDRLEQQKQEQKAQYERSVTLYVNQTTEASNQIKQNVKSAVQQGLQAKQKQAAAAAAAKKRKREEEEEERELDAGATTTTSTTSTSLCTLSGDVVVEEKKGGTSSSSSSSSPLVFQIQSHADFSTLALFLDKKPPSPPTIQTNNDNDNDNDNSSKSSSCSIVLYYEIRLVTGGLAQIGWADMTCEHFKPNTDEGDGVGDLVGSYGYDGSRGLKFHNGHEEIYNNNNSNNNNDKWKAGDVVGCFYNIQSGEISYTLNGKELGLAFVVDNKNNKPEKAKAAAPTTTTEDANKSNNNNILLFPALSCNGGEILELHVDSKDMEFMPNNNKEEEEKPSSVRYVAVKELITSNIIDITTTSKRGEEKNDDDDAKRPAAATAAGTTEQNNNNRGGDNDKNNKNNKSEKEEEEAAAAAATTNNDKKKEPVKVEALDLNQFQSATDLEEVGLDRLKGALMAIGVKCGGSLKERAARLFSLKGLERKDYPKKVLAKRG